MFENIKEDFQVNYALISKLVCITYRFGHWARNFNIRTLRVILIIIYKLLEFFTRIVSQCEIPSTCKIGKGLRLEHGGKGTVFHSKVVIGEYARVFHQVTIGVKGVEEIPPCIGSNVLLGVGSKIIGDIRIGDNVQIGANAVVTKDLPNNCTAIGIPARVIKTVNN